ncbi:MAG: metal-dependent transcriptional regulator [Bacilli bacterium]|nr:metal-dependent transcriptional regulator [Bacilli bacterium]
MDKVESREDYLEAILQLEKENERVRSIDVVRKLGFSKPSVSIAMKKLKDQGYIIIEEDGSIKLLDEGRKIALKTLEKHEYLTNLFIKIGVDKEEAEDEACKIEHAITDETFEKIKKYLENCK